MAVPLVGAAIRGLVAGTGVRNAVANEAGNLLGRGVGSAAEDSIKGLVNPLTVVTGLFGKMHAGLVQLEAPFKMAESFFQHVGSYVGKFNPASVGFFERSVSDFQASVGQVLQPMMKLGTGVFRKFADTVAYFQPIAEKVFDRIGKGLMDLTNAVVDFTVAIVNSKPAMALFKLGADFFLGTIKTATALFKAFTPREVPNTKGLSVGKSYVNATTTSVSAMLSKLQESSYGLGTQNYEEKSLDLLGQIAKNTGKTGQGNSPNATPQGQTTSATREIATSAGLFTISPALALMEALID